MGTDDSVRSTNELPGSTSRIFRVLAARPEDELYAALAQNVRVLETGTRSTISIENAFDVDNLKRDAASIDLGRRIFKRWNQALFQFVCRPDGADQDIRDRLIDALTSKEGGAAVLAGVIVASFGASPAVAAVVSALLLKVLAEPAQQAICEYWAERLDVDNEKASRP